MLRRFGAAIVVAIGVVLGGTAAVVPAAAHAELQSSTPSAGATIHPGEALVLTYDDPVVLSGSSLTLGDAEGANRILAPLSHAAGNVRSLTAAVPDVLPAGKVQLHWRALADDGHVTTGSLAFTLAPIPGLAAATRATAPAPAPITHSNGLSVGLWLTRLIGYLALCLLCGGLAFLVLAWPAGAEVPQARRLLWVGLGAGMAAGTAAIPLEVAYINQTTLVAGFRPSAVAVFLATPTGRLWAARVLLYVLAVPVVRALSTQGTQAVASTAWRVGAGAVGIALLRTPGLLGHSEEGPHGMLGTIADLVHISGVAVWLGGLAFLIAAVLPLRDAETMAAVMPRFSLLALGSVAAVAAGGAFMTWQLVGSLHGLTGSHYGRLLLLKLTVVGGVLAAASRSKSWVESRLDHAVILGGDRLTVRPLIVSVSAEVALAVLALAAASVLVATPPVR